MVSGLSTSPLDSANIDSGEPNPIVFLLNLLLVFLSLFLYGLIATCSSLCARFTVQDTISQTSDLKLYHYSSNLISNANPFNSCLNTLNDSGNPGSGIASPFTIAS